MVEHSTAGITSGAVRDFFARAHRAGRIFVGGKFGSRSNIPFV